MRAIDTNVLVRFLTRDDEQQFATAETFMASLTRDNPGYVTTVALVEVWWVLSRAYGHSRSDLVRVFSEVLDSEQLLVQDADVVRLALRSAYDGADFADAVIAHSAAAAGCSTTVTFDRGAAESLGMQLLP